jgi:hypothetical protein
LHRSPSVHGLPRALSITLAVGSVAMFVATLVAIPMFLVRVPDDYFARPRTACSPWVRGVRAALGLAIIALGAAMLVLPGQGVLTILVGLSVLDLPINDRIVTWLLGLPRVRHAVDTLRHRAGRGPLLAGPRGHASSER